VVKNTPTAFQLQRFLSSSCFSSVTILDSNNNINIYMSTRISSNIRTSLSSSSLLMLMMMMRRQSSSFSRRINTPLAGTTLSIGSTKSNKHFVVRETTLYIIFFLTTRHLFVLGGYTTFKLYLCFQLFLETDLYSSLKCVTHKLLECTNSSSASETRKL